MHAGAKGALRLVSFLFCIMIITLPLGLYFFWKISKAQVELGPDSLRASSLGTKQVQWQDIAQIGVVQLPVAGGFAAQKKCGGKTAVHLAFLTKSGKTIMFMASMFENHDGMLSEVASRTGLPLNALKMGAMKPKWASA